MKILFSLMFFTMVNTSVAQNIQITLGPDEIAENQGWTISITVSNDPLKSFDPFPDIDGLRKRGQSSQATTSIINGQVSSSQSLIMTYAPTKQGIITVPSFSMKVNGKTISVAGKKVKVGPPAQQPRDPFRRQDVDDFFGRGETEFVDIKEDAFLALTTSKDEVYAGEGFTAALAFYIADGNRAPLQFSPNLSQQLGELLKKLKPVNCWEENFNIENIEGEAVKINGKDYLQYKIYQATYFPLNSEPVVFPSVGLEMIKYKVARNPSFFGQNRKEDYKTFYTKAKRVNVKPLPPHPLRNSVAVGDYRLDERLPYTNLTTGQSASYEFNISGEGNISAIDKPIARNDGNLEFYEPNVRQDITRDRGRITGTKSFNYFIIPKEPGKFSLGDYFQWVYFNPRKKQYDTLRSNLTVNVTGESKKNEAIESSDPGSFYARLDTADNTLQSAAGNNGWQKWVFNIFILVVLAASAYLVLRKTKADRA